MMCEKDFQKHNWEKRYEEILAGICGQEVEISEEQVEEIRVSLNFFHNGCRFGLDPVTKQIYLFELEKQEDSWVINAYLVYRNTGIGELIRKESPDRSFLLPVESEGDEKSKLLVINTDVERQSIGSRLGVDSEDEGIKYRTPREKRIEFGDEEGCLEIGYGDIVSLRALLNLSTNGNEEDKDEEKFELDTRKILLEGLVDSFIYERGGFLDRTELQNYLTLLISASFFEFDSDVFQSIKEFEIIKESRVPEILRGALTEVDTPVFVRFERTPCDGVNFLDSISIVPTEGEEVFPEYQFVIGAFEDGVYKSKFIPELKKEYLGDCINFIQEKEFSLKEGDWKYIRERVQKTGIFNAEDLVLVQSALENIEI